MTKVIWTWAILFWLFASLPEAILYNLVVFIGYITLTAGVIWGGFLVWEIDFKATGEWIKKRMGW